MSKSPLNVAISAVVENNRILLIKREKGDYAGLLGLPGGKVKTDEHIAEAAIREIREETGIECVFEEYLGVVSEHLIEDNDILQNLVLHVFLLTPDSPINELPVETGIEWYNLAEIEKIKEKIIPSDYFMLEKMLKNREKNYFDCVLEKRDESYFLKKFE